MSPMPEAEAELQLRCALAQGIGEPAYQGFGAQALAVAIEAIHIPVAIGSQVDLPVALLARLGEEGFKAGALPD